MQRLLVALDGSAHSLRALRYAVHLAQQMRAELDVVNVQPPLPLYGVVRATMDAGEYRAACEVLAREALAPAGRLLRRARVRHRLHVRYGEPGPELAASAPRLKCKGIVMGTRGLGAAANLLLGSVAAKVVHLAKVPVTLVK